MLDCVVDIPFPGRALTLTAATARADAPRQAFPAFVAGPENRLVAQAIQNVVANAPAAAASPPARPSCHLLVLFGVSGVGKSHLAQGLVRYWQAHYGEQNALYTTAADFRYRWHDAARRQTELEFRAEFRGRQLLVIENLHHLPNNDHAQRELRYTLDDYDDRGGLVVLTSTSPPNALPNLSPDVRSRLAAGLLLQLAPPGEAARTRILHYAANALGRSLAEDTARHLAHNLEGSAGQLLGAIIELCAAGRSSTIEDQAARRLTADRACRKPTMQQILALVARDQNVPQSQLKSGSRRQSVVFARGLVVYLARELAATSYCAIGRTLGGRDHTTVLHSYRKIAHDCECDPRVRHTVASLRRALVGHET